MSGKKCGSLKQHTYFMTELFDLRICHLHEVAAVVEYFSLFGTHKSYDTFHKDSFSRSALAYNQICLAGIEFGTYIMKYGYSLLQSLQ